MSDSSINSRFRSYFRIWRGLGTSLFFVILLLITACDSSKNPFRYKLNTSKYIGRWSAKKDSVEAVIWDITSPDSLTFILPKLRTLKCSYWMEILDSQKYLLIYPNDSLDVIKYKIFDSNKDELLIKQVLYWHFYKERNSWKEWSMPEPYNVKIRLKLRNI